MNTQSQVMRARLHLLRELRAGRWRPGAAISVKGTAEALKLSPTPVREALAALAGEGAVALAGDRNGFIVPRLGLRGYVDLTELVQMLVDGVLFVACSQVVPPPDLAADSLRHDPLAATEAMIAWMVGDHGNAEVARALGRAGTILAPYRRAEAMVIPAWHDHLLQLQSGLEDGRGRQATASYWRIRIDLAGALVDAVEHPREPARYIPDIVRIG